MTRYRRSAALLWRRSFDQILVLARGGEDVTSIGGGAVAVWDLLDRPRTAAEITGVLERSFAHAADDVARDVAATIADLAGRGLLEPER